MNQTKVRSRAAIFLQMHTLCMHILTSNLLVPGECCFDTFKPYFQRIVELAEEVVKSEGEGGLDGINHFQTDAGLIPPSISQQQCAASPCSVVVLSLFWDISIGECDFSTVIVHTGSRIGLWRFKSVDLDNLAGRKWAMGALW